MRRVVGITISLVVLLAVGVLAFLTVGRLHQRPRTDDAYLKADISTWPRT